MFEWLRDRKSFNAERSAAALDAEARHYSSAQTGHVGGNLGGGPFGGAG